MLNLADEAFLGRLQVVMMNDEPNGGGDRTNPKRQRVARDIHRKYARAVECALQHGLQRAPSCFSGA